MKLCTHNGPFHADDVFAGALLAFFYPQAEFVRTRDPAIMDECDIVFDVGGIYDPARGRFDHHMADFDEHRENGVVLSSFGLLWREYGLEYCEGDEELAGKVEKTLVDPIDAVDNGQDLYKISDLEVHPFTINSIVQAYRPSELDSFDFDDGYSDAVGWAGFMLERVKLRAKAKLEAERYTRSIMDDARDAKYVIFDKHVPYSSVTDDYPQSLYALFPGTNKEWIIRAAPLEKGSTQNRKSLPEAWRGLEDKELEAVCGVAGAKFCHRAGWIAGANTKDAAIKMVELAIAHSAR
ncbi:MAG: MYG1 family protein [Patescibacteria group bacterium]